MGKPAPNPNPKPTGQTSVTITNQGPATVSVKAPAGSPGARLDPGKSTTVTVGGQGVQVVQAQ